MLMIVPLDLCQKLNHSSVLFWLCFLSSREGEYNFFDLIELMRC